MDGYRVNQELEGNEWLSRRHLVAGPQNRMCYASQPSLPPRDRIPRAVVGQFQMTNGVPILIVGNSPAMRSRVTTILALHPHWEVCGEVPDCKQVVERVLQLSPQVILLDLRVLEAFESILEIHRIAPTSRIVMVGTR
jgi:hypothetical protein